MFFQQFKHFTFRVRELKSTPIYVKPQLISDGGTCHLSVLVGIRNDPGKTIDSVTVQFQLPPFILSADLTSNHGTVNILAKKVLSFASIMLLVNSEPQCFILTFNYPLLTLKIKDKLLWSIYEISLVTSVYIV